MLRKGTLLVLSVVVWVSPFVEACRSSGTTTYLLGEGYIGPVVVVYDVPAGEAAQTGPQGEDVFTIPSDGVLIVQAPSRGAGWHDVRHYYLTGDGARERIPRGSDDADQVQIFDWVDGVTVEQDDGGEVRWDACVVGVPSSRDDWTRVRNAAVAEVIRRLLPARVGKVPDSEK